MTWAGPLAAGLACLVAGLGLRARTVSRVRAALAMWRLPQVLITLPDLYSMQAEK